MSGRLGDTILGTLWCRRDPLCSALMVLGLGIAQQRRNHPPAPSLTVLVAGRVFWSPTDN